MQNGTTSSDLVSLHGLVREWITNHPKYQEHYYVTHNAAGGIIIYWIQCYCQPPGTLPPTPIYDILIMDDHVIVWRMKDKLEEARITASDPNFFTQLEHFLDICHP